ncbi:helix-turn-helix transcriptional regulator [Enterococcus cecorum]|nr:helix-turn-helix transcriptional regulator [Enterococcus cecorum]
MTIYERIRELASEKGMSIRELENSLGFSNGLLRSWNKSTNSASLEKVANYFNVSTDYLLGRTNKRNYYELTEKDEKNIEKQLQEMINDLENAPMLFYSEKNTDEFDDETKELLKESLKHALRIAKIEAKRRYTPKKYR